MADNDLSAGGDGGGKRAPRVLCYPDLPLPRSGLYHLARLRGWEVTDDPDADVDLAVRWRDITRWEPDAVLAALAAVRLVVNLGCGDIGKDRVDATFERVFGYGVSVDPRSHHGPLVTKSTGNGTHSGELVEGPLAALQPDVVYQRLVDTRGEDGLLVDIRLPIVAGASPWVCLKYRGADARFDPGPVTRVEVLDAAEVLNDGERAHIRSFCREMGLDFGDLDVLRDRDDGRIYVVDVNNTPMAPTWDGAEPLVRLLADAFDRAFLPSWAQPSPPPPVSELPASVRVVDLSGRPA